MPILALLLLMAGLCGGDVPGGSDSLRGQILQADAQHAAHAPAPGRKARTQILRLSAERALRLARGRAQQAGAGHGQAHTQGLLQLWQYADGRWQLQRTIRVELPD